VSVQAAVRELSAAEQTDQRANGPDEPGAGDAAIQHGELTAKHEYLRHPWQPVGASAERKLTGGGWWTLVRTHQSTEPVIEGGPPSS
jgi:hypothetical protein